MLRDSRPETDAILATDRLANKPTVSSRMRIRRKDGNQLLLGRDGESSVESADGTIQPLSPRSRISPCTSVSGQAAIGRSVVPLYEPPAHEHFSQEKADSDWVMELRKDGPNPNLSPPKARIGSPRSLATLAGDTDSKSSVATLGQYALPTRRHGDQWDNIQRLPGRHLGNNGNAGLAIEGDFVSQSPIMAEALPTFEPCVNGISPRPDSAPEDELSESAFYGYVPSDMAPCGSEIANSCAELSEEDLRPHEEDAAPAA